MISTLAVTNRESLTATANIPGPMEIATRVNLWMDHVKVGGCCDELMDKYTKGSSRTMRNMVRGRRSTGLERCLWGSLGKERG